MNINLLTEHHLGFLRLKGDFTGSSESRFVKMPHCLKSYVTTHIAFGLSTLLSISYTLFIGRISHKLLELHSETWVADKK